jgi:hypothetical protein
MNGIRRLGCLVFLLSGFSLAFADDLVRCEATPAPGEIAFVKPTAGAKSAVASTPSPNAMLALKGMSDSSSMGMMRPVSDSLNVAAFSSIQSVFSHKEIQQVTPTTDQQTEVGLPAGPSPKSVAAVFSALGYGPNAECTHAVASGGEDSNLPLVNLFGDNDADIDVARKSYLANPAQYTQDHPTEAAALKVHIQKWQAVLTKCFKPASESPAYSAMKVSAKLGHLAADQSQCLAYLVSKDHIVTARHCVFDSSDLTDIYEKGAATFTVIGDSLKHYQVCAAETTKAGKNIGLPEEELTLRIAPVKEDVSATQIFDASTIKPLMTPSGVQLPTSATVFSWIPHASEFDSRYTEDLGVAAGPGCYVIEYNAKRSCFTHFCPTYQGTSGSPLFAQASAGDWRMLAVHIGVARPNDGAYGVCTEDSNDAQNAAVTLDASALAKYMNQGK